MPRPAPRYLEEDQLDAEHGWPAPRPRPRPVRAGQQSPPRRVRRARRDRTVLVLVLLALALGAGAAIWYLTLDRAAPAAQLSVPRVVGMHEAAAVRLLTHDGFTVRAVERPATVPAGVVFAQRPAAHTTLSRGATVTIRVGDGRAP